jgi:hypothetical protein
MSSTYQREMEHAQRDAGELRDILIAPSSTGIELTRAELMEAIGLASATREALMRAAVAREEAA